MNATEQITETTLDRAECVLSNHTDRDDVHLDAVVRAYRSGALTYSGDQRPTVAQNVCGDEQCVTWGHWELVPQIRFEDAHALGVVLADEYFFDSPEDAEDHADGADLLHHHHEHAEVVLYASADNGTRYVEQTYVPAGRVDARNRPVYTLRKF